MTVKKLSIILLILGFLAIGFFVLVQIEAKRKIPVACDQIYNPVCGKDNKTYSNSCMAKLAGMEIDYRGECGK